MRKTFLITFFCSLIAISGPAKATDYDFGDITAGTSAVSPALSFAGSTSFIDHFLFTLTAPVNFSSVFTNVAPTSSTLFSEFSAILSQTSPFPVSGSFSSAQIPSGGTLLFNAGQCVYTINVRLTRSQQIEIRTIENEDCLHESRIVAVTKIVNC